MWIIRKAFTDEIFDGSNQCFFHDRIFHESQFEVGDALVDHYFDKIGYYSLVLYISVASTGTVALHVGIFE